ncbi:hypothetical protein QQP08_002240 [Theobroma cacao]|nr:hypothetical protein QQP08_002240 [Theobroma cacao]
MALPEKKTEPINSRSYLYCRMIPVSLSLYPDTQKVIGSSPSFARLILNASAFWYAWPHMGTTAEYLFPKIFLLKEQIGALSHGILAISSNAFSQREDQIGVVNSLCM